LHGYVLSNGTFTAINYPAATFTEPRGINNAGQIVGTYGELDQVDTIEHGFLYNLNDGTYTAINYPAAFITYAWGINDAGQIVGEYENNYGIHGFLYNLNDGTYTTLDAVLTLLPAGFKRRLIGNLGVRIGHGLTRIGRRLGGKRLLRNGSRHQREGQRKRSERQFPHD
jgi:uncharacterized membrane protein